MSSILGPIATLAAALAAVFVTWRLGKGQLRIAEQQAATARQQANTALDQLRYNLFEKRYAIYKDIQELIRLLVNDAHKKDFSAFEIIPHYVVMDEARFFFSQAICVWMQELQKDCQEFLLAHASRGENPQEYSDTMNRLVDHLSGMPQRFQQELGFSQLTQPSRRSPQMAMDSADLLLAAVPLLMIIAKYTGKIGDHFIRRVVIAGKTTQARLNAAMIIFGGVLIVFGIIIVCTVWLAAR
jgi:hypothetical protein